jgi:molecular chaperone HtpG
VAGTVSDRHSRVGSLKIVNRTFQVDLRGVVDLMSHHLYASPRVYLRELLQNGVDAITARRADVTDAPATITIEPADVAADGALRITDTGVGLTEAQVQEFLATIGRSTKRDDLGFARHEFLGQFGIGLLSCFLVADEIRVDTRAAGVQPVRWRGFADGSYRVEDGDRADIGTTVTLVPRRGVEELVASSTVVELAGHYGSLLPCRVTVATPGGPVVTSTGSPPWNARAERRARLYGYCQEVFGFVPLDVVDLTVPEAGLTGVAFVLPQPASPAARAGHRVYLKRMLLAEGAEGLLPDWAFFARCVVDATELRPTASREALFEDGLLESTREAIGDQLRGWLVGLATTDPRRLAEFLSVHNLGVKALALHDDEMLRVVETWWPMETNVGRMTLAEFRDRHGLIRYTSKVDEFRQLASVAAAQDLPLVNGGYIYESELIERLPAVDRSILIERLEPSDLTTRFDLLDPGVELSLRPVLAQAQRAVDRLGCEVVVRSFEPTALPALYLVNRAAAVAAELRATRERVDDVWAGVLDALAATAADERPQLVLNYRNPLVRRIAGLADESLVGLAVQALYGQALLLGYHPIRPADAATLNSSFLGLLNRAVPDR